MEPTLISLPSLRSPDNGLWRDHALCKGMGNERFFNDTRGRRKKNEVNEAIRICLSCPVRRECLRFAIANDIMHGVWGGMTPEQRKYAVSVMPHERE